MKIGLSVSVIQRGKTGIAQYVFALTRAFLEHAEEHEFFLFVLEEDLPLFDFARERMTLVRVSERHRPAVKNILWHQTVLPRLAKELGLDVLHVPSYRRLLWSGPCALVATIHDLAPFRVARKYDWKRMLYGKVVVKRLARRQDAIIAISRNTARDITEFFGIPEKELTVIHNGLDHARFSPGDRCSAKLWAAEKHGLSQPFFLYISRLEHPGKNHVRLIEAFNRFKESTGSFWQMAFGGSDWDGAEVIHAAARQSKFANDIKFLGFVADNDLPALYRSADTFVYPSLYEGFGLPPVEAMACGCPVICSARGSLEEVAGDAAVIIDPENIDEMAAALGRMAGDGAWRAQWVEKGFQNARRFDWQSNAAQTLEVYARAAKVEKAVPQLV